jgi:dTDP-glucose 4,6-dehydratase
MILVTGGAGFIGSNFVSQRLEQFNEKIVVIDKLTYAGDLSNLSTALKSDKMTFLQSDISNAPMIADLMVKCKCRAIVNFAAETHVDRSISGPSEFLKTNALGTLSLLETVRDYFEGLKGEFRDQFRFLNVSTDEVFGSLERDAEPFFEDSPYRPNNPYAASKAAADHLVRAFQKTYGIPVLTTHCSNNFGPCQNREKLVPKCVTNALFGDGIPIYGDGSQVRDWIFVRDHCSALSLVLDRALAGAVYNIGADAELTNLELVQAICDYLDVKVPTSSGKSYRKHIIFVEDRKGHDKRYAINSDKIKKELGWTPNTNFQIGIEATVDWYLSRCGDAN